MKDWVTYSQAEMFSSSALLKFSQAKSQLIRSEQRRREWGENAEGDSGFHALEETMICCGCWL